MKQEKISSAKVDIWRKAILAEREENEVHPALVHGLTFLPVQQRQNALVLGDASLVQAKHLLDSGFNQVVDVDSSPSLMDDDVVETDEERVRRVVSEFDEFEPTENVFDFVYGKSIAFNPKETMGKVLDRVSRSLNEKGVFTGTWALDKDTFRLITYEMDELADLIAGSNLDIIDSSSDGPREQKGLVVPGVIHTLTIVAKKSN